MYSYEFAVRYYECDPMGVVHHSEYIRYFELARNRWLHDIGYTMDVCEEDHVVFPVTELDCKYLRSAKFGGTLVSNLEVESFSGARACFHQQVLDPADGTVYVDGHVTLGFLNTVTGRVMRCPERLMEMLNKELIK